MSLDDLAREALEATRGPLPDVQQIEVARDLYEQMRADAACRASVPYAPTFSAVFGIPLVIDDDLAPGEFRVVAREATR